jgi:hypothetical protein
MSTADFSMCYKLRRSDVKHRARFPNLIHNINPLPSKNYFVVLATFQESLNRVMLFANSLFSSCECEYVPYLVQLEISRDHRMHHKKTKF